MSDIDKDSKKWHEKITKSGREYNVGWTEGEAKFVGVDADALAGAMDVDKAEDTFINSVSGEEKPAVWKKGMKNAFSRKE